MRRVGWAGFSRKEGGEARWRERAEAFGEGSKVESGGVANLSACPRSAKLFDDKSLGAHDPSERLKEYLRLLSLAPSFFRIVSHQARRKEKRCKRSPMGISAAGGIMKGLCELAGLGDKGRANHSPRARMIAALGGEGCNSEAIVQRSDHRSSSGAQQRMQSTLRRGFCNRSASRGGRR